MWLLGRLVPDHKVIAEFRRVHREAVAEAGASLIRWARAQAMLASGWVAIDGSKFRSVSSTRSVATAREAMQRYLAGLDEADAAPPAHPEPEARLMRSVQEGHVAAYNVQTAVDAATGLIVAHEVTTEATDNRSLLPMAEKARTAVACETLHVVADAGYSSGEQARACEQQGIVTHVPANRAVNNQGDGSLYDHSAFAYDEVTDTMRCPAGHILARKQIYRRGRAVIYAAEASACGACALKTSCTTARRRMVTRHWDEAVLRRMHARATPEAMRLRRCTVERPFAELKERHMGRRFLLRGLDGTRCEMAMAVMAFNLKRLIRLLGAQRLIGKLQLAG
jgi:transposase